MKKINTQKFSKIALLALVLLVFSACENPFNTSTEVVETTIETPVEISFEILATEIETLKDEKKYDAAILKANKLLKNFPEKIESYFGLAELYTLQPTPEKLSKLVEVLAAKFGTEKGVLLWQVRTAIQNENFQGALDLINPLLAAESETAVENEVLYYFGLLKILQNDFDGGKEIMETLAVLKDLDSDILVRSKEILEIYDEFAEFADGKNAHFFALISKNLIGRHELVLAKKFAENAAKEDVNYIDAWILSGFAKHELGQYSEALIDLNLAYDQDALRPETHFFLAETLQKLNRHTEAALYYEKALENGFEFTDSVTRQLIDIFSRQKKFDKTLELYDKLLSVSDAKAEEFVAAISLVLRQKKDPAKALELAQKVQQQFGQDVVAWNLLAWAETENDLFDEAQGSLDAAFKLDKNNARTFLNQGFLTEKEGDLNEAVDWFQKSYQRGKETNESAITNLAADKYNELIEKIQSSASSALDRPTSAP